MSERKPSYVVKGIVRRALKQDCVEAQIWGSVAKNILDISAALKVPKNTVTSSFLHGRSLEPPTLFLELAKLSNQRRRALVREVTKKLPNIF